jgi:hypothetical protein
MLLLLLDDTSPCAVAVDQRIPASASQLLRAMEAAWPRLRGRIEFRADDIGAIELEANDVVVSAHACGPLTDRIIECAMTARTRVAVLPCCHAEAKCDSGGLHGWLDIALAIDVTRAARLRAAGYSIHTQHLPADITAKNRLLIAEPG